MSVELDLVELRSVELSSVGLGPSKANSVKMRYADFSHFDFDEFSLDLPGHDQHHISPSLLAVSISAKLPQFLIMLSKNQNYCWRVIII